MKRTALLVSIGIGLALAGCSKDENGGGRVIGPPGTPSTQMTGVFLNTSVGGLLDVTIETSPLAPTWRPPAAAGGSRGDAAVPGVSAFGTMSPDGGGTVNLTGTYDPDTDSLYLNGQGYALAGLYLPSGAPPRLQGRFSGPLGNGSFLVMAGSRTQVRTFCATYENGDATLWGALNFAISGTSLAGFEVEDGDTVVVALSGSSSGTGTTRALAFLGGSFQGSGTWDPSKNLVQGDWLGYVQSGALDSGVWSGEACLPGTTGSEGSARLISLSARPR